MASSKYVKKYKCPYCNKRLDRVKLVGHIEGSKITDNIYTDISFDFISQELKKIK